MKILVTVMATCFILLVASAILAAAMTGDDDGTGDMTLYATVHAWLTVIVLVVALIAFLSITIYLDMNGG